MFVMLRLARCPSTREKVVYLAADGEVLIVSFLCCLFSYGSLGGIWDLFMSVPEIFSSYVRYIKQNSNSEGKHEFFLLLSLERL